ncbi:DUF2971 domain-containing protein [Gimesia aquarii]|uniref:DUF2971 domain-containing protein n=1 Tax=Gimesia aquarii TaxID=2527964 RepID=A0A517WUW1_9PLAN|nr:DUF2971 domain-containing protein [Gimesia aquarii]QDU09060.1 hypothetical protein V202x_24310 [Gimesia aquarii]
MKKRPDSIFKYESFTPLSLKNLQSHSIYFGAPKDFNDPYDCAIPTSLAEPTDEDIENLKSKLADDPTVPPLHQEQLKSFPIEKIRLQLLKGIESSLNKERDMILSSRGISCFSAKNDNLLMWSHYADKYRGYCMEFSTKYEPFSFAHHVKYTNEIPQISMKEMSQVICNEKNENNNEVLRRLFCIKSLSWEYEEEWRVIRKDANITCEYDPKALQAVYLGPDMEDQIVEIMCLILKNQNQNVRIFKGELSSTQFRVEFKNELN